MLFGQDLYLMSHCIDATPNPFPLGHNVASIFWVGPENPPAIGS